MYRWDAILVTITSNGFDRKVAAMQTVMSPCVSLWSLMKAGSFMCHLLYIFMPSKMTDLRMMSLIKA